MRACKLVLLLILPVQLLVLCMWILSTPAVAMDSYSSMQLHTSSSPSTPEQATEAWYSEVAAAYGNRGYQPNTASNDAIYGASGGVDQVGH